MNPLVVSLVVLSDFTICFCWCLIICFNNIFYWYYIFEYIRLPLRVSVKCYYLFKKVKATFETLKLKFFNYIIYVTTVKKIIIFFIHPSVGVKFHLYLNWPTLCSLQLLFSCLGWPDNTVVYIAYLILFRSADNISSLTNIVVPE